MSSAFNCMESRFGRWNATSKCERRSRLRASARAMRTNSISHAKLFRCEQNVCDCLSKAVASGVGAGSASPARASVTKSATEVIQQAFIPSILSAIVSLREIRSSPFLHELSNAVRWALIENVLGSALCGNDTAVHEHHAVGNISREIHVVR